jgi:methyl-accepting chemotaxis protein
MVKRLYAPAYWVLGRLNFVAAFMVVCGLFLLPTLVALLGRDALPPAQLYGVVGALCALAIYALLALRTFVSVGIARIIAITDRIASGELVTDGLHAAVAGTQDAGRLWNSIMRMNGTLSDIVKQVRSSAEAIASASHVIAEGNSQLAQRTQEQAASLEETASGIEQLAASAQQNAEGCARANDLAGLSREVAAQAAERMQQVTATMKKIDTSARRVGEILGTVEGIAFQTNILALNAAVEAARAGDQGRGFAVVAAEVRNLAQRSASAAKEIQSLIGESLGNVEKGRQLVEAAEATMTRVVGSVEEVTQVLGTIALASREQSAGVQEINLAIAQVDAVTQQNAALVEEAAGAAESFQHEARQLVEVVGRFKTDRNQDRGRVIALVKAGVAHVRQHGIKRAAADFHDRNGRFRRDEDYLVALDALNCTLLAFPPAPHRVGEDDSHSQDADGRHYARDIVDQAKARGQGWYDYSMPNPRTGQVEPKSMYFERIDNVVIGCGIYRREAAARHPPGRDTAASNKTPAGSMESSWPRLAA